MANMSLTGVGHLGGATGEDRSAQRATVAAYFGLRPEHLAGVRQEVVELMAARIQGDRRLQARLLLALDRVEL